MQDDAEHEELQRLREEALLQRVSDTPVNRTRPICSSSVLTRGAYCQAHLPPVGRMVTMLFMEGIRPPQQHWVSEGGRHVLDL